MKKILAILSLTIHLTGWTQSEITWSMPMNVATSSNGNMHPRVMLDALGNPMVLWGKSNNDAMFSRWTGTSFSTPIALNSTTPVFTASWAGPDLASDGDTVYAVFKETPEDLGNMFMVHSYDGGMTFSDLVQIDNIGDSVSRFPTVTVSEDGQPIVAFMKFNSSFGDAQWVVTTSLDFGSSFPPDVLASGWNGATVCDCCPGGIVANENNLAMLYRNNSSNIRDTWASISTDGGNTFDEGINIDQENWMLMACPSSGPDGFIANDTLYAVYMSGASGTSLAYMTKTSLNDISSEGGEVLTGNFPGLSNQNFVRMANSGSSTAIVWKQSVDGNNELALLFTSNMDNGWPDTYEVPAMDHVVNADVAISDGNIYLVWEDDNSGTVKYRKGSFSIDETIIQKQTKNSLDIFPNPFVAEVQLTFENLSNGKVDIMIQNILGEVVHTSTFNAFSGVTRKLELENLEKGMYLVQLTINGERTTRKIVKQ